MKVNIHFSKVLANVTSAVRKRAKSIKLPANKRRAPGKKKGASGNSGGGFPWRRIIGWGLLVVFLVVGLTCIVYGFWASKFDLNEVKEMPSRSTVYDRDGAVYSRLQGENRIVVPLDKVSKHFVDALLAREDSRFYAHRGVDPLGIVRAVLRNVISRSAQQGASTLTQQLARNSFPEIGQTKSLHRKLLEAFVAARIEQRFSKEEILESYLNRIYFGGGVYGIEAASMAYFGKHASDLTLGEAAMVTGVIRAPSYSSPFNHFDRAIRARDAVLDRMVATGKLRDEQAAAARNAKIVIPKKRPLQAQENYAMDAVVRDLNAILSDEQRAQGGLKIYTTIDPTLQKAAERSVETQLQKIESRPGYTHPRKDKFTEEQREEEAQTPYLQGAAVVLDNRDGGIRALVGGRDYGDSKYNRALSAKRQVGSTFKPFVYAAAIKHGVLPGTNIDDGAISAGEVRGAPGWTPGNSDGTYKGIMHAEEGLIQSRNTMSVRVGQIAGLEEIARLAGAAGIAEMPQRPASYLGAFEATLVQMTNAYSVFPNQGTRRQAHIVERVVDASGDLIYNANRVEGKTMDPGVCWLTTSMLMKVLDHGTGAGAKSMGWNKPAAGKTGTTNDYKDAWFVGYTSSLTAGVWVGLDKPETIMAKGYGAALALPIWVDVMNAAGQQRYPALAFKPGVQLQRVGVCASTGELATAACDRANASYTAELPVSCIPRASCHNHGGTPREDYTDAGRAKTPGILRSFKRFFTGE
jgi:penicillin-binding protein 1A